MEASITLKKVGKKIDDKTIVAGLTFGIERGSLAVSYTHLTLPTNREV